MERDERRFVARGFRKDQRGAALVLEIIIYLVIIGLIFVAVISAHRYYRGITYVMHAKQDARHVQEWTMGQYHYNNVYPNRAVTPVDVKLTVADGNVNDAEVKSVNGPNGTYCVHIVSNNIIDAYERNFWIDSEDPHTVVQGRSAVDVPCIPQLPASNVDPETRKYPVCHNGEEMLSIPYAAFETEGHSTHSEDIIPPIPQEGFPGKNWDKAGAKKFANCG